MTRAVSLAGLALWSGGTALAALFFLHSELQPSQAALCGVFGWLVALALAPTWSALPRFVTGWLAAGVATVASLLAAAGTAVGNGIAYLVLRGPELVAVLVAVGLVGTLVAALGYTHHRLAREVAEQAARVAQLRATALESHLAALTARTNPHFLFNTLNTLAQVVHEDADTAEDLVLDLAHMMRYTLRSTSSWVPLSDEIDVVRRFFRLEHARLGDRLSFTVEASPEALEVLVPGLIVQPLVENAVHHAVARRTEGGRVGVTARREGDRLRITVVDDGPGLPEPVATAVHDRGRGTGGAGGGLYTTAERVRLAWSEGAGRLTVMPGDDGRGTRVVLDLPAESPGEISEERPQ